MVPEKYWQKTEIRKHTSTEIGNTKYENTPQLNGRTRPTIPSIANTTFVFWLQYFVHRFQTISGEESKLEKNMSATTKISDHITSIFLEATFHKFYLIHF